jgi:hypothetical protein
MRTKYIIFLLFPVFFILSSCTNQSKLTEDMFDFSTDIGALPVTSTPKKQQELKTKEKNEETDEKKSEQKEMPENAEINGDLKSASEKNSHNVIKRFNLGYLTFDVADFYAEIKPIEQTSEYTKYVSKFYSRSNGFIDYLFGWRSNTIAVTKAYKNKTIPQSFRTKVLLKKKTREIAIDYDKNGKITFEQVTPPDNRAKRPAVEDSKKIGSLDPLSIVLEAHRMIKNGFVENNFDSKGKYVFSLPLYDGRRRSDINFEVDKKKNNDGLIHLKITQKPLAGYTENEWREIRKGERSVDIYLNPTSYWPVQAEGKSALGSARAKFLHDCQTKFEECIKLSEKKSKESDRK